MGESKERKTRVMTREESGFAEEKKMGKMGL